MKNGNIQQNEHLDMIYTIEHHLKNYADSPNTTERHEILWHAWSQNKKWLTSLLEWTISSYPTYSYHNQSHADAVLHNIERVLGTERIKELSASDCFAILHAVYLHDIGMSISARERSNMMKDDRFIELILSMENSGDADMRKAAESVLKTRYTSYHDVSSRERSKKMKMLFDEKLDVYYGLGQLMSEYQRTIHADKVKDRMHNWTLKPEQLGNGFSVSGIPLRIFLRIADCASIHTSSGIEPVLNLPKEDNGYVLDTFHPRFVAVMLQLGDVLDMDNDRFNPFSSEFAGSFPRTSMLHFKKHNAIRQLNISPKLIQIYADCDSQEVLRMVRMECESLEEILKNASYYWAEIAPNNLSGGLPTLEQSKILLDGQRVPGELVKAQFNISQVRAFRLLEGGNVYGGNFVFLREIIQNAIDASKLQSWEDYIYHCRLKERKILHDDVENVELGLNASEKEILSEIDVWDYPIELYFEIGIQIRNEEEEFVFISLDAASDEDKKRGEYGVRFIVKDHGTGISKADLIKISNVGSSYEEKKHFIDKMPDWLKPTGQFGIGLQSAFLVTNKVVCRTYTRGGEKYEITFNKVSNGSGGYINVKPLPTNEYLTFGTIFDIFVNYRQKKPHIDCWNAWNIESAGADRFSNDYDRKRPLRHSQELMAQMIIYIDELLGENLFPVYAKIKGKHMDKKEYEFIKKSVTKIALSAEVDEENQKIDKEKYVSWLFKGIQPDKKLKDSNLIIVDIKDGIGALDCEKAKLYIWNSSMGVFAQFGGARLLSKYSQISELTAEERQKQRKTRIYLKGIYVQSHNMYHDSELLELIDIKGGKIGKEHVAINRNEFTRMGIEYLEKEIYPEIIESAKNALIEINEQTNLGIIEGVPFNKRILYTIAKKLENCDLEENNIQQTRLKEELEETILSAIGLAYFLRVIGKEKSIFCNKNLKNKEICRWNQLLGEIVLLREECRIYDENGLCKEIVGCRNAFNSFLNCGLLHKMPVFSYETLRWNDLAAPIELDYASLLSEKRKVAIISIRQNELSQWFHVPLLIYDENENHIDSNENPYEVFERKVNTFDEEQELREKLENWANELLILFESISTIQYLHDESGMDSNVQYTLRYMLSNIPSVAIYSNQNANVRINVLASEANIGVFYNKNMKRHILKKIYQKYMENHAKYFITPVWKGYECLALKEVPTSVCIVNGVYMARQQCHYMLIPIYGENIRSVNELEEQAFYIEILKQKTNSEELEKLCDRYLNIFNMFQVVKKEEYEGLDEVAQMIHDYIMSEGVYTEQEFENLTYGKKKDLKEKYWQHFQLYLRSEIERSIRRNNNYHDFEYINRKKPDENSFRKMLINRFFANRSGQSKSWDYDAHYWDWFISVVSFIKKYRNPQKLIMNDSSMVEFKKSIWSNNIREIECENQKIMIEYVQANTGELISEKQINGCYENMIEEMIKCIVEQKIKQTDKKFSNIDDLF